MAVNGTLIEALEPISGPIAQVVQFAELILGGVVGIALLSLGFRIYYSRKLNKRIDALEKDIAVIKSHVVKKPPERPKI